MMRTILSAVLAVGVAASAWADVTVKQTGSGKGMGMSGNTATVTYIKGLKMRTDTVSGDTTRSMVFDVEGQKMYTFDSKKKEADEIDMAVWAGEIQKNVRPDQMKASLKANGQTKQIGGKTATGYDMEIMVPMTMGGGKDEEKDKDKSMQLNVMLSGPLWIVKGAPGTDDYARFYRGAAEKGFIFTDPRAAKSAPGQAKAMAEMYKQMASLGGVPYETEMNIKMAGEGPLAGIVSRMGGVSMTSIVQSIETGALDAGLFAPPAGYKVNTRK